MPRACRARPTRFWCAKEAAGKASGKRLEGNPRALTITAVDGERIQVKGQWVTTQRRGPHILAWTESAAITGRSGSTRTAPNA